jgi:RNA polymerase sigma factor (TIGR02999 family)
MSNLDDLATLFTRLQTELRSIARRERRQKHLGDTYSTTVVVNELYLKLSENEDLLINDEPHFYATACNAIRYLLVDVARKSLRQKRGAGAEMIALQDCNDLEATQEHQTIALSLALNALESEKPRQAQVVQLRYFGGLADSEIGRLLQVDESTVRRDWQKARARLFELVAEA